VYSARRQPNCPQTVIDRWAKLAAQIELSVERRPQERQTNGPHTTLSFPAHFLAAQLNFGPANHLSQPLSRRRQTTTCARQPLETGWPYSMRPSWWFPSCRKETLLFYGQNVCANHPQTHSEKHKTVCVWAERKVDTVSGLLGSGTSSRNKGPAKRAAPRRGGHPLSQQQMSDWRCGAFEWPLASFNRLLLLFCLVFCLRFSSAAADHTRASQRLSLDEDYLLGQERLSRS